MCDVADENDVVLCDVASTAAPWVVVHPVVLLCDVATGWTGVDGDEDSVMGS